MTKLIKKLDGSWECETDINFDDKRTLRISTSKVKGQGVTTALVVGIVENFYSFSTMIFQDFSKTITHPKGTRATEKNIARLHREVLADKESIITEAKKHYESLTCD